MNWIKSNRGYTIIEMTISAGLVAMVALCTSSMMVDAMRSCDTSTLQAQTDTNAVTALQKIVSDVREATSYTILANACQLELVMPTTNGDNTYNRRVPDTAHPVDYYRSDATGVIGHTGNYLWRSQNGARRIVSKNVVNITFEQDAAAPESAVKITVDTKNLVYSRRKAGTFLDVNTHLTDRVVYLRND